MKAATCLLVLYLGSCALAVRAASQEPEVSRVRIGQLRKSREKAQEELRRFPNENPPEIERDLAQAMPIAILRFEEVSRNEAGVYILHLQVERTLRGTLPQTITMQSGWHEGLWLKRPPFGWNRIKPEVGKRVAAGFYFENGQVRGSGTLDLSNSEEAKFLPAADEFLRIESKAESGDISGYINALRGSPWFVRFLAVQRLSQSKACLNDASCEEAIVASIRRELKSKNPNERALAVTSLRILVDSRSGAWRRDGPWIKARPVHELLDLAVNDVNVAIGDEAFYVRATLDFDRKENAGYCEEIISALRRTKKYPFGGQHTMGGPLSAGEFCIGPMRARPRRKESGPGANPLNAPSR